MSIKVVQPGILTTLQDLGRYGYKKYGVIVSGAMDTYSMRLANILVGNDEGEAVLEMTLLGPTLVLDKGTLFAITGADLSPTVNGEPIPLGSPVLLREKGVLRFGTCKSGCRGYLALAGGFAIPEEMGSKSTYLRAGIGGFQGRKLEKEDVLDIRPMMEHSQRLMGYLERQKTKHSFATASWRLLREQEDQRNGATVIRVMRDRHFENFTEDSRNQLFRGVFEISQQSDRMGYRLSSASLTLTSPLEMISEATNLGTIQVPPDGNPIILLADSQTIGGYPKIAQVAAVDIHTVVQLKPGQQLCFEQISVAEAEQLYMERERYLQEVCAAIEFRLMNFFTC
jgi:antagonist of KipI